MNWLDRLRGKPPPDDERREKREMQTLRKDFSHAVKRAVVLENQLHAEMRRLEKAPWKR